MMSERGKQIEECFIINELIEGKLFSSRSYSEKQDGCGKTMPIINRLEN